MPRRARITVAGVPHHVVQRGHNRQATFFADEDYLAQFGVPMQGTTGIPQIRVKGVRFDLFFKM